MTHTVKQHFTKGRGEGFTTGVRIVAADLLLTRDGRKILLIEVYFLLEVLRSNRLVVSWHFTRPGPSSGSGSGVHVPRQVTRRSAAASFAPAKSCLLPWARAVKQS